MYIAVNDVISEKRIDLAYPIQGKEVVVVSMLSDNVQYWLKEPMKIRLKMGEDMALMKEVYMDKELNIIIGPESKLGIESRDYFLRANKLENVTKLAISLEELDSSDNLDNGRSRNTLFTYYVTGPEYSMHFEPHTTQYKKLKNGMITSLILRIMDQNNIAYPTTSHGIWGFIQHRGDYIPRSKAEWDI